MRDTVGYDDGANKKTIDVLKISKVSAVPATCLLYRPINTNISATLYKTLAIYYKLNAWDDKIVRLVLHEKPCFVWQPPFCFQ